MRTAEQRFADARLALRGSVGRTHDWVIGELIRDLAAAALEMRAREGDHHRPASPGIGRD